jgi:hypothetical protein
MDQERDRWVIARWSHRRDGGFSSSTQAVERTPRSQGEMRTSRIVRTLVVAGTTAALTLLSVVTTVMAATGGGDFPRLR